MSVYTHINFNQLEQFLGRYPLGKLIDFQGIAAGIDNSNYALCTTAGDFILTIFESLHAGDVSAYLKLLSKLSNMQFPCPRPQVDLHQQYLHILEHKPAAVFKRISGTCAINPTMKQCWAIGEMLGLLHMQTRNFTFQNSNRKGDAWLQKFATNLKADLTEQEQILLADELKFQARNPKRSLPQGIIHADLFRDNVLFDGDQLTGVLDFYSACNDDLLLDLAITINDWCSDKQLGINQEKKHCVIAAYESKRCLTAREKSYLPVMLRWAALRFWLSRVGHQGTSLQAAITTEKDPAVFRRMLEYHQN